MNYSSFPLSVALVLATFSAAAQADQSPDDADLRCMAVMAKINQVQDPRHQLESLIGGYYYLGRLNISHPGLDLAQGTADTYAKMSPSDFLSETARCESEMQNEGHAMTGIGAAMSKISPSSTTPPGGAPKN